MTEDDELFAEIAAQAEKAEANNPQAMDLHGLASVLGRKFEHRSVEEIEQKLKEVWRAKGLFWHS
ncbi:hypothetical protein [Rhizobium mesosinicum]|uniref:Uncharacterized protein n=1 Tax=Rhizobium mesosinicum TaxID=335017 RepID=A0ABS7GUK9_9HYPH|nr:hypothetical protein [Rhizobium mesosinicum]MBW9053446.1 hypothetical protein [Rhizobium mesosinicum]